MSNLLKFHTPSLMIAILKLKK